jgi:hypothetical protein
VQKECKACGIEFEITDEDLDFYERVSPVFGGNKIQVSSPEICPNCRAQNRFTFRNFFNLYKRKSDLSGKEIISMYYEDSKFPVYDIQEWWSDKWDASDYGKDVDLGSPIFPQIQALHNSVPHINIANIQCENCDYSNLAFQSRNCYLVFGCVLNEGCAYGHIVWQSKHCFDCLYTYRSEFCYECIDCVGCYNLFYSRDSEDCSDSEYLARCQSCKNCFGCVGLKQKEYYILNEKVSKNEYESRVKHLKQNMEVFYEKMKELESKEVAKHYHGKSNENVTGDYLYFCKNTFDSYDLKNCEDCKYCATDDSFKDCHDCNFSPPSAELSYSNMSVTGFHILFCHRCVSNCAELLYCDDCHSSKNCFGCFGMNQKEYCILNKQYSQNEYEALVPKIIEKMKECGEWSKYFPVDLSPFAYNETVAQEYFPLTKEEVESKGWRWRDKEDDIPDVEKIIPASRLPDAISDIPDDILNWAIECEKTKRPFRIVKQELEFHRKMNIPVPHLHPDERHKRRMQLRNPRKLWQRECGKCNKEIQTTYDSSRPEIIYCEKCYLSEVY